MFDIGFWELAIISIVALLVMGPEKLPGLVRDVSKWTRKIRRFVAQTRNEIERELTLDPDNDLSNTISELDELVKHAPDKLSNTISELDELVKHAPDKLSSPENTSGGK